MFFVHFLFFFFQPNSHISILEKNEFPSPLSLRDSRGERDSNGGKLRVFMCLRVLFCCGFCLLRGSKGFLLFRFSFRLIFTLRDKCVRVLAKLTIKLVSYSML